MPRTLSPPVHRCLVRRGLCSWCARGRPAAAVVGPKRGPASHPHLLACHTGLLVGWELRLRLVQVIYGNVRRQTQARCLTALTPRAEVSVAAAERRLQETAASDAEVPTRSCCPEGATATSLGCASRPRGLQDFVPQSRIFSVNAAAWGRARLRRWGPPPFQAHDEMGTVDSTEC